MTISMAILKGDGGGMIFRTGGANSFGYRFFLGTGYFQRTSYLRWPVQQQLEKGEEMTMELRDRYRGSLLGLAVGDALGAPLEGRIPGSFTPLDDMVGAGSFPLKTGEWTDDTSMALCLATSLVEQDIPQEWRTHLAHRSLIES